MKRTAYLLYGVACYAVFLATFLYLIAFVEGTHFPSLVPRTVDAGGPASPPLAALVVNVLLLSLFGIQHSVMARRGFKELWTRLVPEPAERSTYVLLASVCLIVLYHFWRPIPQAVWSVENQTLRAVVLGPSLLGWGIVLLSTFLINHFDLFGLRQVWFAARTAPRSPHRFRTPLLYKLVRHPIYLGFTIAFWAAPTMTVGRLVFAAAMLIYVLVAIRYEERDLVREYGDEYLGYKRKVRALVPVPR